MSVRRSETTSGVLDHLDATYALAYLSSGDGDDAERLVTEAFMALSDEPTGKFACPPCAWRALADYVRQAGGERAISLVASSAPFKDGGLSQGQREAIALVLGGHEPREAADLLGVSLVNFERHLRSGLEMLHRVMSTVPISCQCTLAHATAGELTGRTINGTGG
jgi:hypothetical protein